MKIYFENTEPEWMSIVPFDKVSVIRVITEKRILVFDITSDQHGTEFPIEQLQNYKNWLSLKQQALVNKANPGIIASGDEEELLEWIKKFGKDCEVGELKLNITLKLLKFLNRECLVCKHFGAIFPEALKSCFACKDCKLFELSTIRLEYLNRKWQES